METEELKNIKSETEELFDYICSEIGFDENKKNLREAIKIFGKLRFSHGCLLTLSSAQDLAKKMHSIHMETLENCILETNNYINEKP